MHIIKGKHYTGDDEKQIKSIFDKTGNVDVEFDYVNSIIPTQRGKSKMLVQHIKV